MGYVQAKIGLTRHFGRHQPGHYLKPWEELKVWFAFWQFLVFIFSSVSNRKSSCPTIDIFIKRLQKMSNKLKSYHQTGSKFKFTLVYKYFNYWRAGPYIGTQIQLELDNLLQLSETEFTSIMWKFDIKALQSSAWKTWWASFTEITCKSWHGHNCIILKSFPYKSWNSYYISDPIRALSITEFVSFLPQIIP